MKPLGICLVTPEEKLVDDIARGFFKVAYLDKSPQERLLIDQFANDTHRGTFKSAGFWGGVGGVAKGIFVDPAIDTVKSTGDFFTNAARGNWSLARKNLLGAALNGGMTALNFVPGWGLAPVIGKAGLAGVRTSLALGKGAWATRAGLGGLGRTGALSQLGVRIGSQGGTGALRSGINLASSARVANPPIKGILRNGLKNPWTIGGTWIGLDSGGNFYGPNSPVNSYRGVADIGLSRPNDPTSIVNTSALGLPRGTTTGLPHVSRS